MFCFNFFSPLNYASQTRRQITNGIKKLNKKEPYHLHLLYQIGYCHRAKVFFIRSTFALRHSCLIQPDYCVELSELSFALIFSNCVESTCFHTIWWSSLMFVEKHQWRCLTLLTSVATLKLQLAPNYGNC